MISYKRIAILVLFLMCTILSACESGPSSEAMRKETVTPLKITYVGGGEQEFKRTYQPIFDEIQNRLPKLNLNFEFVQPGNHAMTELIQRSTPPDLIMTYPSFQGAPTDAIYPLDKEKLNISSINAGLLSSVKSLDPAGRLLGIPTGTEYFALYYNKEAFDYFHIDYPDKNMTWERMLDIAERMVQTAHAQGYNYSPLALSPTVIRLPLRELDVRFTDPKSGEVLFTGDSNYLKYLQLIKRYFSIPGTQDEYGLKQNFTVKSLPIHQAMRVASHAEFQIMQTDQDAWKQMDVAPVPTWEMNPERGPYLVPTNIMMIPLKSVHKNEAVAVMEQYLSSDIQTMIARTPGRMLVPVVTTPEVLKPFGANNGHYLDKNVGAFFARKAAIRQRISKWDAYLEPDSLFQKFIELQLDIPAYLDYLKKASTDRINRAMVQNGK